MQKILFISSIVLTAVFLFLGYQAWQDKLADALKIQPGVVASEDEEAEPASEEVTEQTAEDTASFPYANLPENAQSIIDEHAVSGEPVQVVFAATESAVIGEPNWTTLLESALSENYAGVTFNVETFSYNETSEYWADNLAAEERFSGADLILFEAPTIYDNGLWSQEDQLFFLEQMLSTFSSEFSNAVVFMQPSHPIANASIYTEQVSAVKEVIEASSVTYLDHWGQWPAGEELNALMTEDNDPTEEGRVLWGEELVDIFVSSDQ
ncbi:hypothetical protein JMA_29500 [Jeotgalibacillus malaysiensis]|uniref:SGNH hydrolase-type esterase domain-containing protein n=1 Tax=Jeotgalibacillus malaysiensis TaxID=1508404 RepID=A0A0B5AU68_9BACL|nr:SGNH/GDSL hydrolase family protein [Jeotgalibacillus malaysiensis]AJD92267.1 hypothetical protein JMA_29500 [Jeotgalibacillus malaysiensis]